MADLPTYINERFIYTIYENPLDFPGDFVVTTWDYSYNPPKRLPSVKLEKTLAAARTHIPPGYYNLGRSPEDEKQIVESWV